MIILCLYNTMFILEIVHQLTLQFIHIIQHSKYSNQRHLLLSVTTMVSFQKFACYTSDHNLEMLLQCHRTGLPDISPTSLNKNLVILSTNSSLHSSTNPPTGQTPRTPAVFFSFFSGMSAFTLALVLG